MERYVIAVDQSTSASKVFLIDGRGEIVRRFAKPHQQYYPKPAYVEHDAEEIWQNVREGIAAMAEGLETIQIAAIGISNQRETTVMWERGTGKPVCRAVVWQDVRGETLCNELKPYGDIIRSKTGLALSAYYPAAKVASVLREQPALAKRADNGELCIGTVDSYLVYRLTGGRVFRTDVSNASRTELCDLHTLRWDGELCQIFGIAESCLPEIIPSDGNFGVTACEGIPEGIPITGVMGDSHAALFGQGCLKRGMAKATFGTGSSVMMNVGTAVPVSHNGLSVSVGFSYRGETCYVLEGNITCSADTLCWLRDEAEMVPDVESVEPLAASVPSTEGVYLVPAFSGLGAPYFDGTARAAITGMNRSTRRAHIVRAALESMAYQDVDVIEAMRRDTGEALRELRVDGGPTRNRLLMQLLADLLGCGVRCAAQSELSALGAGYMAGLKTGVYTELDTINAHCETGAAYRPAMDAGEREALLAGWHSAVERCRR